MHPIQQHTLRCLSRNTALRYSQIKPEKVEGNLFMYHLKKLLAEGLVCKVDDGYAISREGIRYIDSLNTSSFQEQIQPKIVTLIACQNTSGEWLLYRRKKHPFIGLEGFPYGKIHLGEGIHSAATRELAEKTGLEAKLVHRGDAYLTTYQGEELISQMFCHIFLGTSPKGELIEHSVIGECYWKTITNADSNDYFPGFKEVLGLLEANKKARFFQEYTFRVQGE